MAGLSRLSPDYVAAKVFKIYLRLAVLPPPEFVMLPGYLHTGEGFFLHWLARRLPPNACMLEVGSFKGKSSCYIASGLQAPGARLHCVDVWTNRAMPYDPPEDVLPVFERNVARYRDRIEIHRGYSAEIAAQWTRPIDALFVDGDHSYKGCLDDIDAWLHHVRPGGWIAFHDSGQPGVARAIGEKFPRSTRSRGIHIDSIFAARKH